MPKGYKNVTIAQLVQLNENYEMTQENFESALGQAIATWQDGQPIPMTLFAELAELGYDVPALEAKHFNWN